MVEKQASNGARQKMWHFAMFFLLIASLSGILATGPARATSAPAGALVTNMASATYIPDGYTQEETVGSNQVQVSVEAVESLTLTQDQTINLPPAGAASLGHILTNTGNVESSYTFAVTNNGPGCGPATLNLSGIKLVRDVNANGIFDSSDQVIDLGAPGALTLQPGEAIALLVQGTVPSSGNGTACFVLSATTALQQLSAANIDTINVGNVAAIQLIKSASYPGFIVPGETRVDFRVVGTNVGAADAQPASTLANGAGASTILVNGNPTNLVLFRDKIPVGTHYVSGTLQSANSSIVRLFHYPGDPAFSYRTVEDASADEVAIGLTDVFVRNGTFAMNFSVLVNPNQTGNVVNTADSYFNDSVNAGRSLSNSVIIPITGARIGVSKAVAPAVVHRDAAGTSDGTMIATYSVRVKNYGSTWLYDVQADDVLEGSGASRFGTYTSSRVPGEGQYTIVPGSLRITHASTNGARAAVNPDFTGANSSTGLLAPGTVLPVDGELTVEFSVQVNITGRTNPIYNSVKAAAALLGGGPLNVTDMSVDGANPDPDDDGDPGNNALPTPLPLAAPALTLVKTASLPRRLADGVYEVDYEFVVTNTGSASAPNVRVIDNFDCTFEMDKPSGPVTSWTLVGPVRTRNGILAPASTFTGQAACNRSAIASSNPYLAPTEVALSLSDGSRSLAPGQSETLSVTVRVTEKSSAIGSRVLVTNKAWAAAYSRNTVNTTPGLIVAATSSTAVSLLADPQGVVYNSVSRAPIAGAIVTLTPGAGCAAGPIQPTQIFAGSSGIYTYNSDGSVSMASQADGSYQFYLLSPPVTGRCTYTLKVDPPAGSKYVFASELIGPASGTFSSCGAVVPNGAQPQGGDPTTYFLTLNVGFDANGATCEATHNHIPLDPGNIRGLILNKTGSKAQVEFGDFVDYALTLTNKTGFPVDTVRFTDNLPAGFAYVPGTSQLAPAAGGATARVDDPTGGLGPSLVWAFPNEMIPIDGKVTLRYRVRVGVGSPKSGRATNRASANSGPLKSNEATYSVTLTGGVFSDEAFLIGKVYMACARPGTDGHPEEQPERAIAQSGEHAMGVPGVRLYLEDGTNVVTDSEGKWSLYGLKPITHVIRIDQTTLPPGTRPEIFDNRNAEDPQSRFVDLKNGELHKADFPLTGCDSKAAMEDVAARRKLATERGDAEGEAAIRTRLDPQGRIVPVGDLRSLPASGGTTATGNVTSQFVAAAPLIDLPQPDRAQGGTFLNGLGNGLGTLSQSASTGAAQAARPAKAEAPSAVRTPTTPERAASPRSGAGEAASAPAQITTSPGVSPGAASADMSASEQEAEGPADRHVRAETVVALEALTRDLDNKLAFIGLDEGATMPSRIVNVRVKGQAETNLVLSVNGKIIPERRVGKKVEVPASQTAAWEYIGVELISGTNALRLEQIDPYGQVRGNPVEIHVVAPGTLAAVQLDAPASVHVDGRTPIAINLKLTDDKGVPITARTQISLESDAGRWVEADLNPDDHGLQQFVTGGEAVFHLVPPSLPGTIAVRASAGSFVRDLRIALLPELRPMLGVGIVEGVVDLTNRGKLAVGQNAASQAFEEDLGRISGKNDHIRTAGRVAFFFKGTILGQYLLTAAADTDKSTKDRLFRDIRPDEFYPIYGDSSARGFDAQSTQKVYVRIDRDRSYLLYGDFMTASSTEVRQLSQSNRSLSGLRTVIDTGKVRATGYYARTSQSQQVEEFPGKGISGPYYLSGGGANASNTAGDLVVNSETIEILVRDRNQPNLVLRRTPLQRFVDYSIEPLTRRILFVQPIASLDSNLNPQSIRVTYEVNGGGPKYDVAGADVQVRVAPGVQLGVVGTIDNTPDAQRKIGAVTVLARLGKYGALAGELVRTDSADKGSSGAERIELRYQDSKLGIAAQAARSGAGFDNPASPFAAGRTEATIRAEYKASPRLQVRGEAIYSKDNLASGAVKGVTMSAQRQVGKNVIGELGLRYGSTTSTSASLFDYGQVSSYGSNTGSSITSLGQAANAAASAQGASGEDLITLRQRLTAKIPALRNAQVFIEGEQDLRDISRHVLAIGGIVPITDKTRVYGRYELNSSLGGDYSLSSYQGRNVGVLGIEANLLETARIYNEYRLTDALDGRTGMNAIGIRNSVRVSKELRLTGSLEYTHMVGGHPQTSGVLGADSETTGQNKAALGQGNAIAFTSGLEYLTDDIKASGIFEGRFGQDSTTLLGSGGFGYKISDDWSLLARAVYARSVGRGANNGSQRTQSREQIGVAYRPVDDDRFNLLARYEHRSDDIRGSSGFDLVGNISGSSFANDALLPGVYKADILSAHVNYNPEPGFSIMGRLAGKVSTADDGVTRSSYSAQLGQLRLIKDLDEHWDLGLQGTVLHGSGGAWQTSAGIEVGRILTKNLWLSAGYNVLGLSDRDLTAGEYTSRGLYFRLRFKFGETDIGYRSAGDVAVPLPPITLLPDPNKAVASSGNTEPNVERVDSSVAAAAPSESGGGGDRALDGSWSVPAPTAAGVDAGEPPPGAMKTAGEDAQQAPNAAIAVGSAAASAHSNAALAATDVANTRIEYDPVSDGDGVTYRAVAGVAGVTETSIGGVVK